MLSLSPKIALGFGFISTLAACNPSDPSAELPNRVVFEGMCDASAAAALDGERFIVADDEDNVLRVYSRQGGPAIFTHDVSEFLGNMGKKKPKEADLEAAAQIGSITYWITSHGRNSKGKDQPQRERFFATETKVQGKKVTIETVGKPYEGLLDELIADPALKKYGLEEASKLAPKTPGALNIEGMAAHPDGHLYIGFRNPVPAGKALIVPLLNPRELINGAKSKIGEPIELDLGGLGIRGIDFHDGSYVIIAGSSGEGGKSRLFTWDGKENPRAVEGVELEGINPEGIAFHRRDQKGEYFLLSDDGTVQVDGTSCKDLKDPRQKRFRGRVVNLP